VEEFFDHRVLFGFVSLGKKMPAVTGRIEEANVTEGTGKLHCPHMRENSDDSPQIEEKKEKEIKEQATQLDETGKNLDHFYAVLMKSLALKREMCIKLFV